jgi:heme exporter protein B
MLKPALAVAAKDLKIAFAGGQGLTQAALLGLLLIFVFSLALPVGQAMPAQGAAAVFWLSTAFGLVLVMNALYAQEEAAGARQGLLMAPIAPQAVWLGKAIAGTILLLCLQIVFAPAAIAFLNQDVAGRPEYFLAAVVAGNWGLAVLGSLLGALAQGQAGRESLLSVILFPLLTPLLLAGIKVTTVALVAESPSLMAEAGQWLTLALAFDAVFSGAALVLFPFVFSGEEG